jgi:hypothetical protein
MKPFFIFLFTLFFTQFYAQSDCKPYVPYDVGAKWELTSYSPKGKEEGKIAYELIDKIERDNGYTFTVKSISYDKKGEEVFTNEFEAYCKDGKFEFDMAMKMDNAAMQSYQNMEMEMDASEFELPSMDAEVGTTLKDGTLEVKVGSNSISMFTMTVLITDRKVEAKEEIETPAGTFNCLVLTQKSTTKMLVKVESSSKEWYSEGVGLVRSEYYNKKGKLNGYSELTSFQK